MSCFIRFPNLQYDIQTFPAVHQGANIQDCEALHTQPTLLDLQACYGLLRLPDELVLEQLNFGNTLGQASHHHRYLAFPGEFTESELISSGAMPDRVL
jgi:hypothetical protein